MTAILEERHGKVFAIDVGYNQLDWKLRTDERVISMEKTNARYLEADSLGEQVDVVRSFIQLRMGSSYHSSCIRCKISMGILSPPQKIFDIEMAYQPSLSTRSSGGKTGREISKAQGI